MFTVDMEGKEHRSAVLEDITSDVLKVVLRFIYKGHVIILEYKFAKEVLYAANKFSIEGLRILCSDKLISLLNKENVLECLLLADKLGVQKLEGRCLKLITE